MRTKQEIKEQLDKYKSIYEYLEGQPTIKEKMNALLSSSPLYGLHDTIKLLNWILEGKDSPDFKLKKELNGKPKGFYKS